MKRSLIFFFIILLSFCVPKKKIEITPQQLAEFQIKTKEADAFLKIGSYTCLKEAFQIYKDFLSLPHSQAKTKEKFIKTALLLTLREKELGILASKYLEEASNLILTSPSLSGFLVYLDIVNSIPMKSKGIIRDIIDDSSKRRDVLQENLKKNAKTWNKLLKEKSETEEFYAYLYISSFSRLSYLIKGRLLYSTKETEDFSHFLEVFPDSLLIQYKLSFHPKENLKSLRELVQKEPRFYEIYYYLGEEALIRRDLIKAEKNFLKVYEQIPESSTIVISLASIYFAFEEIERSLKFYEEALQMAPAFRDALLGKAICFSIVGKNEEAVRICNELLRLGNYYLGDAYYWLAWNQNELEKLDEAWESIKKSKKYLIGYSQVMSLSGIIAFKKGDLEVAEKDLKEALKLDRLNCEAAFYLGRVYTARKDWKNSGVYYEKAALCHYIKEKALEEKIKEIENSSFSEERKQRLILKKKIQLRKTILTKATFFYNAAAGYFNAGIKEQALRLAQQAVSHSAIKEKAEELILKIKQLK